jgi:hypothetical protein
MDIDVEFSGKKRGFVGGIQSIAYAGDRASGGTAAVGKGGTGEAEQYPSGLFEVVDSIIAVRTGRRPVEVSVDRSASQVGEAIGGSPPDIDGELLANGVEANAGGDFPTTASAG